MHQEKTNSGLYSFVSTMQDLNEEDSFALLEEGIAEGLNVVLASGMNKAVDTITAFKDIKEHFFNIFSNFNAILI